MAGFNTHVISTLRMENADEISVFWVLVERALRHKGWTQSKLSQETGISQTSLQYRLQLVKVKLYNFSMQNVVTHWRIIAVEQYEDGSFGIALEAADGYAEAHVTIIDRPHGAGVFDPRVVVNSCDDEDARRWLGELEHERVIADDCLNWWVASYRASRAA